MRRAVDSANNRVMANDRPSDVTFEAGEPEREIVEFLVRQIRRSDARIIWNVGIGDGSGLLSFMLRMSVKAVRTLTNFDHVIRISVPSINEGCNSADEIRNKAVMAIANELNMDEDNTLRELKNELEEDTYFTYNVNKEKESKLFQQTTKMIYEKLASKKCLVIVENILQSILHPTNNWLLYSELPVPTKFAVSNSYWVISTTSVDAYKQSESETSNFFNHHVFNLSDLVENFGIRDIIIGIELFHVAKSIPTLPRQNLTDVMIVLWNCLLYTQLYSHNHEKSSEEESCYLHCVQSKELVNMWICEGMFSRLTKVEGQHKLESDHSSWVDNQEEILRALLSHSLLYKRNFSSSNISSSSDASCVVPFSGMKKFLAECKRQIHDYGMPQEWRQSPAYKFIESIWHEEWVDKNWVSFFHDNDQCSEHLFKVNPTTTTLILRGCTELSKFSLETLFSLLKNLHVLDLSYTPIELLPISLSEMTNLRFLSLKGCNQLRSLTPNSSSNLSSSPLGPLEYLEFLDLGGVSVDTIPDDVGKFKSKLRYLDLSCPSFTSLSSLFFQDISNLRELFLLGCTSLESLHLPLTKLFCLETFSLSESRLISLPEEIFQQMPKLCDLHLINNRLLRVVTKLAGHACLKSFTLSGSPCITHLSLRACPSLDTVCLRDLDQLEKLDLSASLETFSLSESQLISLPEETFQQMPKLCDLTLKNNQRLRSLPRLVGHASLKSLSLSGSPITHLSLCACQSLETVYLHDLDLLEELDLSATAIKEFPESILYLRGLKRLNLLAVPQLKIRLPWHKLQKIPEVLNFDQFKRVGAHIFLTDSRLFSSFTLEDCMHLLSEGGSLESFFISVSSCNKRSKKEEDIGSIDQSKHKKPSCYRDLPLVGSTFKQQFEHRSSFNRHVEISSPERYPAGLEGILEVTESLSVWDDIFISSLTDLNKQIPMLQECKVARCHHMDSIITSAPGLQGMKLQTLWVSDLRNVTKVLQGPYYVESLKHVHLEHCPKLESIFLGHMMLPSLETLIVLHCGNLRTVFYKSEVDDKRQFPRLHTIQLHELPKLSHLCEKQSEPLHMKEWMELHFRGCWNLQRLPLLVGPRDQKVHVDGEERQCKKLKAGMSEDQIFYYDFKPPHHLASFRECVKNNIFLI